MKKLFKSLAILGIFGSLMSAQAIAKPLEATNYDFSFEGIFGTFDRSEERRSGKECLRLCRSRWSPDS